VRSNLADWDCVPCKRLYRVIDQRAGHHRPPLLAVSIHAGVVPRSSLTENEPRADDLSGYKLCVSGDIVLNRMRAFQGAIGISPERGLVSPDYLVLRPKPEVEGRFLHHLFRSHWFVGEMISRLRGIGSTDQGNVRTPRINADDLGDIPIKLPSLSEQRAIADFLDTETGRVDALISKKRRLIELADLRRRAIAAWRYDQAAHEYGLLPLRHLIHGIEQGWSPECENREADPSEWGVLKAGCVNHGVFHPEQNKALPAYTKPRLQYVIMEGDLLMCRASGSRDLIGNAAIVGKLDRRLLLCDKIYRVHVNSRFAIPEFLAATIGAPQLRELIALGISGATGLANNIPTEVVRNLPVPRLPIHEQSRLTRILEKGSRSTRRVTEAIERQIGLLQERRQALITAAVTGELEIPVGAVG
jgi:type I restriction enzyme S subunit